MLLSDAALSWKHKRSLAVLGTPKILVERENEKATQVSPICFKNMCWQQSGTHTAADNNTFCQLNE